MKQPSLQARIKKIDQTDRMTAISLNKIPTQFLNAHEKSILKSAITALKNTDCGIYYTKKAIAALEDINSLVVRYGTGGLRGAKNDHNVLNPALAIEALWSRAENVGFVSASVRYNKTTNALRVEVVIHDVKANTVSSYDHAEFRTVCVIFDANRQRLNMDGIFSNSPEAVKHITFVGC